MSNQRWSCRSNLCLSLLELSDVSNILALKTNGVMRIYHWWWPMIFNSPRDGISFQDTLNHSLRQLLPSPTPRNPIPPSTVLINTQATSLFKSLTANKHKIHGHREEKKLPLCMLPSICSQQFVKKDKICLSVDKRWFNLSYRIMKFTLKYVFVYWGEILCMVK